MTNTVIKAFVNSNGSATIKCPSCSRVRSIQAKKFQHKRHILNVKCSCATQFKVHLEFRKYFRKATDLYGFYSLCPPAAGGGEARIKDISRSGLKFAVSGKHSIKPGDTVRVKFTLNNRKSTELIKQVFVIHVHNNLIGSEFLDDQEFERELGFYLRM